MAGTIVADTINTGTGIQSTNNALTGCAKAWVKFTGASGAVASSFNVSSVTRTSTGKYSVNLATAMADTNYSVSVSTTHSSASIYTTSTFVDTAGATLSTSLVPIGSIQSNANAGVNDETNVFVTVFGNG